MRPQLELVADGCETRRTTLRAATRTEHDRVEAIAEKAGHFADLEGYRRYLNAVLAIRSDIEQILDASGADDLWPWWPERRIAALMAADMADLGLTAPVVKRQPAPLLEPPELLGVLYVLEGSGLGARVLARRVEKLGLTAAFGARHLHHQASGREAWRDFVDCLDNADLSPAGERACVAAAQATFEAFGLAFGAAPK